MLRSILGSAFGQINHHLTAAASLMATASFVWTARSVIRARNKAATRYLLDVHDRPD
ncbi:hypothetical protein [Streptomyces sp. NPDC016675]|uniref:hypothetical protein n=1 Tax=Streptomyces sp. NPDC016675 TaxID=3364970 RepID=UPI0036F7118C